MKNKFFSAAAILLGLIFISCEEDFNPKADFKQEYVLWCVVNTDYRYESAFQSVILSKLYDVEGLDPEINNTDPVLTGADVRLYADDTEYIFEQDTLKRRDTTRYKTPLIYYRGGPVKLRFASRLKVIAKLPDGKVLSSETRLPENKGIKFIPNYDRGFSTIKRDTVQEWSVWWETAENHVFFPKLKIRYTKKETDTLLTKIQEVPSRYINNQPYFPDYSIENSIVYTYDAIDSAMAMISAGDTAKSNYNILNVTFELIEFDAPLSNYFSSINGYLDNYSIRLDETVYSNINGGRGLFGSSYYLSRTFPISLTYARLFGYNSE